jgi:hypothetical protein
MAPFRALLIAATVLITLISPLFLRTMGSSSDDRAALASAGGARALALRANSNAANANAVVIQVTAPTPAPAATPAPQATAAPPPAAPPPVVVQPAPVAQPCVFTLGFQDLHNRVLAQYGDVIGACLENEHGNPDNRDTLQRTAGGLMVWQATTNTMRFTNGSQTWVYSACGLQTRLNTQTFVWETSPAIAAQTVAAPGTCDLV